MVYMSSQKNTILREGIAVKVVVGIVRMDLRNKKGFHLEAFFIESICVVITKDH